jgi:8-oxo-dGTP pyrophosphatase MutT (NUDIX family)
MINQLKKYFQDRHLPGDPAHEQLSCFIRRDRANREYNSVEYRDSAVLVILFEKNNVWYNVLIERQKYNGTHSQQMAFPGGKMDEQDKTLAHTALREAVEEIGIDQSKLEIIGQLSRVVIPVSKHLVHPFVAWYQGNENDFIKNDFEVHDIVAYPIQELLIPEAIKEAKVEIYQQSKSTVPCFIINNKVVWGATSMILNEMRSILLEIDFEG